MNQHMAAALDALAKELGIEQAERKWLERENADLKRKIKYERKKSERYWRRMKEAGVLLYRRASV